MSLPPSPAPAMVQDTRDFLRFLARHPEIRAQIAAPPDKTLLYAGAFFGPIWKEIDRNRRIRPQYADKVLLPDRLKAIQVPGRPARTLWDWAMQIEGLRPSEDKAYHEANTAVVWRALSGIFASNARGRVSFEVGSFPTADKKVLVVTELPVLLRNPHVDALSKDMLGYYQRCLASRDYASADQSAGLRSLNAGFIAG